MYNNITFNSAYVKEMLKTEKKFLVFAHHKLMLDAISECVSKLNVDHIRIDGSTQNDVRTVSIGASFNVSGVT